MSIELDQQRKFTDQFNELVKEASPKFKEKWDDNIQFSNPSRLKYVPTFSTGIINLLSVALRDKFEILRNKYYAKSL